MDSINTLSWELGRDYGDELLDLKDYLYDEFTTNGKMKKIELTNVLVNNFANYLGLDFDKTKMSQDGNWSCNIEINDTELKICGNLWNCTATISKA